jgi:hypothetical protein
MMDTTLIKTLQSVPAAVLLLIATALEASGDAIVRVAIYNHVIAGGAVISFWPAA